MVVQSWDEALRGPGPRDVTRTPMDAFTDRIAGVLARGHAAGRVPAALDPTDGTGR